MTQDKTAENKAKKCPYCAEEIRAEAVRCKHCKSDLSEKKPAYADGAPPGQKASAPAKEGLFLRTLNCGCAAVFIAIALALIMLSVFMS